MDNVMTVPVQKKRLLALNRRTRTLVMLAASASLLVAITAIGALTPETSYQADFAVKYQSPSWPHPFGTDYMGRDMLARTLAGLSTSVLVGLLAATVSAVMAVILGIAAATLGRKADNLVSMAVNLMTGVPHIILLMLISFVCGRGVKGVIIAVALTHWPNLTRIIRAEVMQLRSAQYVQQAVKMGKNRWWIARRHMVPHLLSQFLVGLILLFPHAILHEAAITFLGFGLPLQMPAIGVILAESMKYLSMGMWWLAFFPGLLLLLLVLLFEALGDNLKLLIDPHRAHE